MNSWIELHSFLKQTIHDSFAPAREGRAGFLENWEASEEALEKDPQRIWVQVDQACCHFAHHRTWPALHPSIAWQAQERVVAALALAAFVTGAEDSPVRKDVPFPASLAANQVLQWALVDYWRFAGAFRQIYQLDKPMQ